LLLYSTLLSGKLPDRRPELLGIETEAASKFFELPQKIARHYTSTRCRASVSTKSVMPAR